MCMCAESWRWPRDLHPFFWQNLPEGYLLSIIREEFGPLLDGTDLSLLVIVGGMGIGRVTVTPEISRARTTVRPSSEFASKKRMADCLPLDETPMT